VAPAADLDAAVAATVEDLLRAGAGGADGDEAPARRVARRGPGDVGRGDGAADRRRASRARGPGGLRAFLAGERPPWR
jgi:hypothetical protein